MGSEKFAFITCVNDTEKYHKCLISSLAKIPGSNKSVVTQVYNAESMTQGYNAGKKQSDTEYKVYIHQDVEVLNKNFFADVEKVFTDNPGVGMIGFAGCEKLPNSLVFWEGARMLGKVYEDRGGGRSLLDFGNYGGFVEAIDGLCMITRDKPSTSARAGMTPGEIDWDERITGFHFYDISQSVKFNREGIKVFIPAQQEPWLQHNIGNKEFDSRKYLMARDKFRGLYFP